ncbi:histidine kinase [Saprospiraceae bacterium]|nr:histidine kinase [Saprospiraceae bacterium]
MYKAGIYIICLLFAFLAKAQPFIPPLPGCSLDEIPNYNTDSLSTYSYQELICLSRVLLKKPTNIENYKNLITSIETIRLQYLNDYDFENVILGANINAHLWFKMDSLERYGHTLMQSSYSNYRMGNFYTTFEYSNKALSIARQYSNALMELDALSRIAWTQWSIRRYKEALELNQEYKSVYEKAGLSEKYTNLYLNSQASFLHPMGRSKEARIFGDSLIENVKKLKNKSWLNYAYSNMAGYYNGNENIEQRIWYAKEAVKINIELNNEEQLGSNLELLASLYRVDKQYTLAEKYYLESLEHSTAINDRMRMYESYNGLTMMFDSIGDYSQAYIYSRKTKDLHSQLFEDNDLKRVFDLKQINAAQEFQQLKSDQKIHDLLLARKNLNLGLLFLLLGCVIAGAFWVIKNNKKKQNKLKQEYRDQIKNHEMESLRAQMNPHFIFNSLNSIKGYITTNESRIAAKFLTKFSKLIRLILNHSRLSSISLEEELESLELYIQLEQLRLENSFDYKIESSPNLHLSNIMVPPMIIQPYVENAIWHGLVHKKHGQKTLHISIHHTDQLVAISITDNGIGRAASQNINKQKKKKHSSHGMNITKQRIDLINKSSNFESVVLSDLIDDLNQPIGTNVLINLSKNHQLWKD